MRKTILLLLSVLFVTVSFAGNGGTVTFKPSETHSASVEITSIILDGITVSISKKDGAKGGTLARTDSYRVYLNSELKIESTVGKITRIDLTSSSTNPIGNFGKANVGYEQYDNNALNYANRRSTEGSWQDDEGKNSVVFFTINGQVNLTSITVTYTDGTANSIVSIPINRAANGKEYNLAGNHVGKDYKGIVISNGKKKIRR